jgi:predicted XRE-type DNA-binding protein
MKIRHVTSNNRRKEFSITTRTGVTYSYPFVEAEPRPHCGNRIVELCVDRELGNEAFTFLLESGEEGTVHIDHVFEYNEAPGYLSELLIYKLTLEAKSGVEHSGLSMRQIARRLQTSLPQLYRLLDPANTRKSMGQLVTLLHVLGCEVDVVVKKSVAA